MALHRIVISYEQGDFLGLEFVNSAKDRDAKVKEHKDKGRKAEAATGQLEGFNFIEG